MTKHLSATVCDSLVSIINEDQAGASFEIPPGFIELLLQRYNVKVQATESGHVCFHSIRVGAGAIGHSSGAAFAGLLKSHGCRLNVHDVEGSVLDFCAQTFKA